MKPKLKADLYIHTEEDPQDNIEYTARQLIDAASEKDFEILVITNHGSATYSEGLKRYAQDKNILLIPGEELSIQKKHVVVLNAENHSEREIKTFHDIKKFKNQNNLVIAPHPFFLSLNSLNSNLSRYIDLQDVIEYTHFYCTSINFNKKAEKIAL